jgi:hypothetical protein
MGLLWLRAREKGKVYSLGTLSGLIQNIMVNVNS